MPLDPNLVQRAIGGITGGLAPGITPPFVSSGLSIPSSLNFGPTPSGPSVTTPNIAKLNSLQSSGDGISQIQNPLLRGIARTADVTGSVFSKLALPQLGAALSAIPGTAEHHQTLVHQAQQNVANDQAQAMQSAQLGGVQARTRLENDQANAAEAPASPEYDYVDGPNGKVAIQKGTTNATSVLLNGAPLGPKVETPKSPLELALRDNPNLTAAQWQQTQDHPLTQQEADALNGTWDKLAAKHGLPTGQFKAGVPRAEATMTAGALNQAIGKQQGDTHVSISMQGLADHEKDAAAKNTPLNTSDPATQQAVSSVANGSLKLTDVFGRGATTAQKAAFVAAVKGVNPNYNSGDHDIEVGSNKYFTVGKGGQTLAAFQATQNHLQVLANASDALHNGNITAFNKLSQSYAQNTGSSAPTDFNAVKNAVKGEVSRALTGNVTVSEQAELDKDFNNASSPAQIAGVARKYTQLIDGKKAALKTQYENSQKARPDFGGTSDPLGIR